MDAHRFGLVVPAAGSATRFRDSGGGPEAVANKILQDVCGLPMWQRAIEPFLAREDVVDVVMVLSPESMAECATARLDERIRVVEGGAERVDSVAAGVAALRADCTYVAIHDAARPCVSKELVEALLRAAVEVGAAVPALPVTDALKRGSGGRIERSMDRNGLYAVQTPQVVRRDWLEAAIKCRAQGFVPADEAALIESLGHPCCLVEGSPLNMKVTYWADLEVARALFPLTRG